MSRPKVGDIVSFRALGGTHLGEIVTGRVVWLGACGIDVQLDGDYVTIDEEDIVPTPASTEGS